MSLLAICLGGLLLLWSLVCLLGGPDGKFGEPESFVYASLFGILGFLTISYARKWFLWSINKIYSREKTSMPSQALPIIGDSTMERRTGEKIGWTAGWSGGFIWVIVLSVIFLIQNKLTQGLLGFLLAGLAAISIVSLAPWRHPATPYWKLMVPTYMFFFGAILWAIWAYGGVSDSGLSWWTLVFLLPLLIPLGTMGKKTWNDLNRPVNTSML
ncbi:MAG: hypothetical protein QG577_60 [Thermodesulfobacteriota bacterium]|nr:hypothetical protein [Thermodesulfobacteriota bacterium]